MLTFLASRTVITSAHPWILLFFVALAYMTWASNMLVWIVDLQEDYRSTWNHTYPQFPVPNPTQTDYDPWGFGQVRTPCYQVQLQRSNTYSCFSRLALSCNMRRSAHIRYMSFNMGAQVQIMAIHKTSPRICVGRDRLHLHRPSEPLACSKGRQAFTGHKLPF